MDDSIHRRLVVIGDEGVGKTSICRRLNHDTVSDYWRPTIDHEEFCVSVTFNGQIITFTIVDTAGQEKYQSVTSFTYRNSDAAFIVFDLTQKSTADSITNWYKRLSDIVSPDISVFVIGNKTDLEPGVSELDVQRDCDQNGFHYRRMSAKTGEGFDGLLDDVAGKVLDVRSKVMDNRVDIIGEEGEKQRKCC
jgi:small GTP-binding protein